MTVFDGGPSLSYCHLLLVSPQKRSFWNTKSKSYFNLTLFDGGSQCQTKTLNLTPRPALKKCHIENDLLSVFQNDVFVWIQYSKCQYDNEVHRQKNGHIDDDLIFVLQKKTHTVKVITVRLEVPTDFFNHFWIQVAVSEVKRPLRKTHSYYTDDDRKHPVVLFMPRH
jgi:hypothetical protein